MKDNVSTPMAETVSAVRALSRQFRAVIDLADQCTDVARIEGMKSEAEAAHRAVLEKVDVSTKQLVETENQITARRKELDDLPAIIAKAKADADEQLKKIAAGLHEEVKAMKINAADALKLIGKQTDAARAALDARVSEHKKAVDVLDGQIAAKAQEHDGLVGKIDDVKARLSAMIGA